MTSPDGPVVVIAPMPGELRPLVRPLGLRREGSSRFPTYRGRVGTTDIVAVRPGIGPERATEATEAVLGEGPVSRVVVSGIAGGLAPATAVGDLVVPAEVVDGRSGCRFPATPFGPIAPRGLIRTGDGTDYELGEDALADLRAQGVTALDMETAAVARVCAEAGLPWTAFRAISDMAGDASVGPVVMTLVDASGRARVGAATRYLLGHPGRIPRMVRLGREADRAARTAARAAVRSIRGATDPPRVDHRPA